jgi:hypothetical protein
LRDPPFPIYGLSERWTGRRFVGGHGSGMNEGITSIQLAHGNDPFDEAAPQIRVEVERREFELPIDFKLEELARSLWSHSHRPLGISSQEEFDVWARADQDAFEQRDATAPREVSISVDGVATPFQYLEHAPFWGAVAKLGDITITLDARNADIGEVDLVRITDPDPYIEGSSLVFNSPH